jgi:hypothetical protein
VGVFSLHIVAGLNLYKRRPTDIPFPFHSYSRSWQHLMITDALYTESRIS